MTSVAAGVSKPVLSDDQIAQFHEEGYVIIPGVLSTEVADHYRQQIVSMVPPSLDIPAVWTAFEGRIKPMTEAGKHNFYTPELMPLLTNETLYRAASQLLGSSELRVKDGSIGITVRNDAHRDQPLSQSLHIDADVPVTEDFTFTTRELQVGGCYYLTDVEPDGGGIHVVPGGHKLVEAQARAATEGGRNLYQNWKKIDGEEFKSIEITGKAGDFALLHHLMPHAAAHNRLSRTRITYFVRWIREDQTWGAGRKPEAGAYSPEQLEAMGEFGRKLFGVDDW